jgi:hypothetical protein
MSIVPLQTATRFSYLGEWTFFLGNSTACRTNVIVAPVRKNAAMEKNVSHGKMDPNWTQSRLLFAIGINAYREGNVCAVP